MTQRSEVLAVADRPRTLDAMIGQEVVAEGVRKLGATPRAWLLIGDPGTGKTTLARIIALSLQCPEAPFGTPTDECLARPEGYWDITEINAADIGGVDDMRDLVAAAGYMPRPPSVRKVYILDEAQRISAQGQSALLKPLEDGPDRTVWILCTSEPRKISKALQSRCQEFSMTPLFPDGVRELCARSGQSLGLAPELVAEISEAILRARVNSPRLVQHAVEQFAATGDATSAASRYALGVESPETIAACRALLEGQWGPVAESIKALEWNGTDALVRPVMGYLRGVLMKPEAASFGRTARLAAFGLDRLSRTLSLPEQEKLAAATGTLYEICARFAERPR